MVEIEYKGGNSVIINTKKAKLICDPKLSFVGLKDLAVKDAIELVTEERFAVQSINKDLIIHCPGEYGVEDFDIKGVAVRRHIDDKNTPMASTMYRIEADGVRIGLLGNVDGDLSEDQLEALGVLDVLILPVGGSGYTLDASAAADLVREISPKIVVPIHYADSGLKYEVPQGELSLFEKEMGGAPVETVSKLKLKQAPIEDSVKIIKVERS